MTATKSRVTLIVLLFVILAVFAQYCISTLKRYGGSYLYGYPLVLMDQTRQAMAKRGSSEVAANHLIHIQRFPDHTFRNVVRPNNDTLYSIAWLDLSGEPLILSVPDTQGRYYVMPFMDAWTNVFASVGRRTTGTAAGHYALTGPDWQGTLPEDIQQISSPTNMVWMIGRIQTNGQEDIPAVAELQAKIQLTPLNRWGIGEPNPQNIFTLDGNDTHSDPAQFV